MTAKKLNNVHVTTLGCSKNIYDSDILSGLLNRQGFKLHDEPENSDIIIINTCGFIGPAKDESVQAILEAGELKKSGKVKKLLVFGCMASRYSKELQNEIPEIDAVFGTEDYKNILMNLQSQIEPSNDYFHDRLMGTPNHYSYLKLAEGCNHKCTFCAIPIMRGNHKSRKFENILAEAKMLVDKGTKELILISQDTTFYGLDLYGKQKIFNLVKELEKIESLRWIRLHYFYPTTVPENIIGLMSESNKLLPYIDIPLQHISDPILKRMKRGGNKKEIIDLLQKFRNRIPDVSIRTSFIVGFPGETKTDFDELKSFIEEFKFDRLGVFKYSHEEGTSSYKQEDSVSDAIKEQRMEELMTIQQKISLEINQKKIGNEIQVILDDYLSESDIWIGRTNADSPEIDNEVIISNKSTREHRPGNIVTVRIEDAAEYELYAKIEETHEN